jgi:arylsulfatase A-like enzyme
MRIPLIIRHRGVIRGGQVSNLMVGQYDFMPTILDYVGFGDVPIEGSPGRSFRRHLKGQRIDNWGEEVFWEQEETRGVRTPRYSYWKRYPALGQNELFDLKKDPGQTGNVVDDPDYGSVVASLDAKVEAFFARYADPEYDLWNGGTTKATSQHPAKWRRVYGPDWSPSREVKPIFVESVDSSER